MQPLARHLPLAMAITALMLAIVGARPYAGGWNDGSRLATVESLVDRHTFVIDAFSPFGKGGPRGIFETDQSQQIPPAPPSRGLRTGFFKGGVTTLDKVLIDGHFYSDKPPVAAMLLAAAYQVLQWTTGLVAREQPERFCWWMNLIGAGVPYVVAVWAMGRIAALIALPPRWQAMLVTSFAFATVAPAYARHVNGHIELLAVAALLHLQLLQLARTVDDARLAVIGLLLGLGYTLDLAAGPLLMLCTLPLVGLRTRSWRAIAICAAAALPAVLVHHGITYWIGGTLQPLNSIPAYLAWPGSPFDAQTMTGRIHHGPVDLIGYALALLFDGRGFFLHNLALLLPGLTALLVVPRCRIAEHPEAVHALAWMTATWLAYALTSTNHSGACLSIRWFVPWLAPAYLLIGLLIREQPRYRTPLLIATAWGFVLAAVMWHAGPWTARRIVAVWPILIAMLVSCAAASRVHTSARVTR